MQNIPFQSTKISSHYIRDWQNVAYLPPIFTNNILLGHSHAHEFVDDP